MFYYRFIPTDTQLSISSYVYIILMHNPLLLALMEKLTNYYRHELAA